MTCKFHTDVNGIPCCWGIEQNVLEYITSVTKPFHHTLETGAGVSTLTFAKCGSNHIAISPYTDEFKKITCEAKNQGISLVKVSFIPFKSERWLPTAMFEHAFDIVLIDGMHSFPNAIIDWFYTADNLKVGGLLILDDIQMHSVRILYDFLKSDKPRWGLVNTFNNKTAVFHKISNFVLDVPWHDQPYNKRGVAFWQIL
ncbi:MAG: class I SAM-dependent methyltransferase [Terracidiphilus sp.]|jgi:hypothetical protein